MQILYVLVKSCEHLKLQEGMCALRATIRALHIDGHESKPALSILAIIEESQKTRMISYFATDFCYDQT